MAVSGSPVLGPASARLFLWGVISSNSDFFVPF
jgi:hypothetical protein